MANGGEKVIEEVEDLYVDLNGTISADQLEKAGPIQVVGAETKSPIIQIGNNFFQGKYKESLGTHVFFEETQPPPSTDPLKPICTEFFLLVIPFLLIITTEVNNLRQWLSFLFAAAIFDLLYNTKPKKTLSEEFQEFLKHPAPQGSLTWVTNLRVVTNLTTCICILAVDFQIFPRRLAKTEETGFSLMDVGTGVFVLANAIVSPSVSFSASSPSSSSNKYRIWKVMKSSAILLALGFVRFLTTEAIDYQKHVTEYGVHWNFFFTLAAVKRGRAAGGGVLKPHPSDIGGEKSYLQGGTKLHPRMISEVVMILMGREHGLSVGLMVLLLYEASLQLFGLQQWILGSSHRQGIISANREGLASLCGYLGLALLGTRIGAWAFQYRKDRLEELLSLMKLSLVTVSLGFLLFFLHTTEISIVSRRLANLSYCLWIVVFYTSYLCLLWSVDILLAFCDLLHGKGGGRGGRRHMPWLIEAMNGNALLMFLWGNLLTGLVNLTMNTMEVPPGSTSIQVTVKSGGLKMIQIVDNGHGITVEDLEIVCHRFTTSKLREFSDLSTISTYGFRGEALASISHVAHLTITTRTAKDQCAFRAVYVNGELQGVPKVCAGNVGTQILVEDLFFNMSQRKNVLKSPTEEYARIADVITRYAIHHARAGFSLKKHGESSTDIRTAPGSTPLDNIQTLYGKSVARDLLALSFVNKELDLKATGYVSKPSFSSKRFTFLLFINHRLVDCSTLKKAIEGIYSGFLGKGSYPWVYLSLDLKPENLDVNVHPTKSEVIFLHQEKIIQQVEQTIDTLLMGSGSSQTYYAQTLLPIPGEALKGDIMKAGSSEEDSFKKQKPNAHELVRMDSRLQKLDKFFAEPSNKTADTSSIAADVAQMSSPNLSQAASSVTTEKREQMSRKTAGGGYIGRDLRLGSIASLRRQVEERSHAGIRAMLHDLTFVSSIDESLTLIQHSTKLLIANTRRLSEELFYQILLYDFANFGAMKLSTPVSLEDLVRLGLYEETAVETKEGEEADDEEGTESLVTRITDILTSRAAMLDDYFALEVSPNKELVSIPLLLASIFLENYVPCLEGLPRYLVRLATEVDWSAEKPCLQGICHETASFYAKMKKENWEWTTEHVVYPAMRQMLSPPKSFASDATFIQVAHLPDLYRVFERC
ncbi:unnamed protein product [Darwinula stevensoni]|uniref:DNA mismatch repair protein S5 domain-containing protein n=1 Tax=Darwinula stevensoni TaxID=69355 RepID=A0A7R8XAI6_9CRUS|nr:unnamed protein product [Darwinula stevensoni]CAG0886731.1 unnamed protein product [Darwinula stevensoni]